MSTVDHSKMKLGLRAVKTDSRTLRLAKYLAPELPLAPPVRAWSTSVGSWGMMLNDTLGDCTIAAIAHAIQVWSANRYREITIPNSEILTAYEIWCGYNPADPSTDQGGVELDVLNSWRHNGLAGHMLLGYADPSVQNLEEIRQTINLFGGVYIGMALPMTAQSQEIWDVDALGAVGAATPGSWGGHAVFVMDYDQDSFTCVTWGQLKKMTVAFWQAYVQEAHALLCPDWFNATGAPNGFNLDQLSSDLLAIH